MDTEEIKRVVECLLFVSDAPLSLKKTAAILEVPPSEVKQALESLAGDLDIRGSSLFLREIAEGWQISSKKEYAPWIRKLLKDRATFRLSRAALETLSVIAYKQPLTRMEVEQVRGVEVSAVLSTLLEKRLIRIVGRKDTLGTPLLYGTSPDFLKQFGLKNIGELPAMAEVKPE